MLLGVTGWEVLTAISVAIIALMFVVLVIVALVSLRDVGRVARRLEAFTAVLERDGPVMLDGARSIVGSLRDEVSQIVATSREMRERVKGTAGSLEERVRDFEAVLDVLQEEVEETALDVAAALRATRRGTSLLGAMKRALFRGRR
jgi:uncharacterized protein YoxC